MAFTARRGQPSAWSEHVADVIVAGRRLHYVDVGSGSPMLLIHGLGASWRAWSGNMTALSRAHRVIAVDLPGFGQSESLGVWAGLQLYADSLRALLDELGIDSCDVVGHSLGGLVSQVLAARHPDRVRSLVLVASGGGPVSWTTELVFRITAIAALPLGFAPPVVVATGLKAMMTVPAIRHRLFSKAVHEPNALSRDLVTMLTGDAWSLTGVSPAILAGLRVDGDRNLDVLTCPVLVIGGEEDRIVTPAHTAYVAHRVRAVVVEIWPEVGHHPMWERPDRFNELVLDFVRSSSPESGRSA